MSSLNSIYIKLETLEKLVEVLKKKQEKGIDLTVSLSDKSNDYNQNVSCYVSQSKEDREANKNKFYVGNGRTFWTKGETPIPQKEESNTQSNKKEDDLPF